MEKKQIIIASILGIAFVLGLSFAAYQVSRIRKVPSEISVTGIAERNFKSDLIVWTATYSVQDYSSSEGYQDLQRIGKEVRNFIKKNDIPDSSYLFSGISISKMYDQVTDGNNYYRQVFAGYNLSQTVTITSQDIDRVEALSRNITELINQGIEIFGRSELLLYASQRPQVGNAQGIFGRCTCSRRCYCRREQLQSGKTETFADGCLPDCRAVQRRRLQLGRIFQHLKQVQNGLYYS